MSEAADQGLIERLAGIVDEFREYYDKLTSVKWGARLARSKDVQLYREYGEQIAKAEALKRKIERVTGAWQGIKEWAGLGALPLIPVVVAIALTAAVTAGVVSIRSFIRSADIRMAVLQDPQLTYEEAADQVDKAQQSEFGKAIDLAQTGMYLVGAFIAYRLIMAFRR